jgi:hypothetical protein
MRWDVKREMRRYREKKLGVVGRVGCVDESRSRNNGKRNEMG